MKKLILSFLLVAGQAHALCIQDNLVDKVSCKRLETSDSYCRKEFGSDYVAVVASSQCDAKTISSIIKKNLPFRLLQSVKSSSDEINNILSMIDRKGLKGMDIFNFKTAEVKTFQEAHVKMLLEKMSVLRERLYLLTVSIEDINSTSGKEAVIHAARYYSFMSRIHQIMAAAAHDAAYMMKMDSMEITPQQLSARVISKDANHKLSYDLLNKFRMKLHKKVGLEILARMNLKAKHLDAETLDFAISEEEKQTYEFNVIQNPANVSQYAKLVQFMSIREFLNNKWSIDRMSSMVNDDQSVSYCGPSMLSFRPGSNQKMSSSPITKELNDYDVYFTKYPTMIEPLVKISEMESLLNINLATDLVQKAFDNMPSFKKRMLEDYNWLPEELTTWRNDIAKTLQENEDKEWSAVSRAILSVSIFPGDKLVPTNIQDRVLEDIFNIRKDAILAQISSLMDDLNANEKLKLKASVSSYLAVVKKTWSERLGPQILARVNGIDDRAGLRAENYQNKINQTKELLKQVITSAYVSDYIIVRNLKKKMSSTPKLDIKDLEPRTPEEMIEFFQSRLASRTTLKYLIESRPEYSSVVKNYFNRINERFQKLGTKLSTSEYQVKLWAIAADEGRLLFAQYPAPKAKTFHGISLKEFNKPIVGDNTRVVKSRIIIAPKISDQKTPTPGSAIAKIIESASRKKSETKSAAKPIVNSKLAPADSSQKLFSIMEYHPMVRDNTRVAMNSIKTKLTRPAPPKEEQTFINIDEMNQLTTSKDAFLKQFLGILNITREGKTSSFLNTLGDQHAIAESRLASAYSTAPLLKIPLERTKIVEKIAGRTGVLVKKEVKEEKPALMRTLVALSLEAKGAHSIDDSKLVAIIRETIQVAKTNLTGKTQVFCLADYRNYSKDEKFRDVFRSSTYLRMNISSNEALTYEASYRIKKLDEELKKATRYWHERINEDYVEPMMKVATVLFILSAFIIPMIGSAGLLTPGSMLLLMTLLDGVDLTLTGASLYFRSVSTFYEIPAQIKFQKSLAMTQIDNFQLTSWDDVDMAQKSSKMQKGFSLAFAPLDAIVGGQFYFSARKLLGVTGSAGLKRLGMATRGFGAPPKTLLKKVTLTEMIKKNGAVRGTIKKAVQEISNLKYYTPRYQAYTKDQLTEGLRIGLVTQARTLNIAGTPWKLIDDLKTSVANIEKRLELNKVVDKITGQELKQVKLQGRMTWKEFMTNPTYSQEFLIPASMYRAIKRGQFANYLAEFGQTVERMAKLRGQFLNKRVKAMNNMISKLNEVQTLSKSRPELLQEAKRSDWMDYFQSLLTDEELHVFKEIAKTSKGNLKEFKSVFKAHESVMETIVPYLKANGGTLPRLGRAYGQAIGSDQADISEAYLDMLDKDGASHLSDQDVSGLRGSIEEDVL